MALDPSDSEVIRDAINARLGEVWTATVGRVQSYDAVKQTVDVLPVIRRPLQAADGQVGHEDLPVIPNVPVLHMRAGGFFVHLPVEKDDTVLLIFTSDSFQMWRESGSVVNPGDLRRHSLSNAIAIPGVFPATQPLTDLPNVGMASDEAVLGGGVYRVGDATAADFVALASKVDSALSAIHSWATEHTHPTAMGPSGNATPVLAEQPSVAATKLKAE